MAKLLLVSSGSSDRESKRVSTRGEVVVSIVLAALCFVGIGFGVNACVQHEQAEAAKARENARVMANIDTFLPSIFRATTVRETFGGLNPEVHWPGSDAKILGWVRDDEDYLYPRWAVLAKSPNGHYYQVKFALCDSCDVTAEGHGPNRLKYFEFDRLSTEAAKKSLYAADMPAIFRQEFGVDMPPKHVNG